MHPRLLDVQEMRLREMDKRGIEMMILSLNAPAIQAIHDTNRAVEVARAAPPPDTDALLRDVYVSY